MQLEVRDNRPGPMDEAPLYARYICVLSIYRYICRYGTTGQVRWIETPLYARYICVLSIYRYICRYGTTGQVRWMSLPPFCVVCVSSYYYMRLRTNIRVLILLCMCPHTEAPFMLGIVSSLYMCTLTTLCVLVLLYVFPHPAICVSSYCYICVLILLCVSSCYYTSLIHLTYSSKRTLCSMRTHILLYICPPTTIYVSTYCYNIDGCIYL